jgi:hypothetical protein
MAKKNRSRIDYMPGQAAFDALSIAGAMFPDLRAQAVIDKLVITGLCALRWTPRLYGNDRDHWKLPEGLGKVPESGDG